MFKKLIAIALLTACGDDRDIILVPYDAAADGGVYGEAEQAYSIPTGTSNKLLGSNSFSAFDECRKNQNATATCRFLRPPPQPDCGPPPLSACTTFHSYKVGITNPNVLSAGQLNSVNATLTHFATWMSNELSAQSSGEQAFGLMQVVPWEQANLAVEFVDFTDPPAKTTSYSAFVQNVWNGCGSSDLPESPSMPGTWRGCTSATARVDLNASVLKLDVAQPERMAIIHGLLVAMGFGRQSQVSGRMTNPTASATAQAAMAAGDLLTNGERCHLKFMSNRTRLPAETGQTVDLDFEGLFGVQAGCGN